MAYSNISNEWLNKNNLSTLWNAIVANFIHAAPASVGDMLYWNTASQGDESHTPNQPSRLTIGSAGQFLGVVSNGSGGLIPQWQTFGTPSLALAGTDSAPTLTVTVQGNTSTGLSLPMADSTHAGLMSTANQGFSGNKTFYGKVTVADQLTLSAAQGTAPIIVASTTKVANLNADLLDGYEASGLFETFENITTGNDAKTVSITIGNTNKKLQVGYASVAGSLDVANKTAWGRTYWNNGTPQDVSGDMSSVGDIAFSASGKTIGGFVKFDTSNARLGVALGTGVSPDEALHVGGNISANLGVSAEGIADLSLASIGGGGGTVTDIMYAGTRYTPSNGTITLPNDPALLAWNNDYQTITSTEKTNWGAMYARVPSATFNTGNELADKAFVNSSIGTATADFKGTVTAAGDSEAQAQTALASITGMDNNDYAFVKVENTPQTGVDKFKRYKYNGSAWVYEYTLNNSSFTANQWSAINSGITATEVTRLSGVETGAQVNKIETVKVNGTALTITNKAVDISVPTALSQLTADTTHRLVTDTQITNWTSAYDAVPVLSDAIGQVNALALDNRDALTMHDGRITDLESYFNEGSANNALLLEGHNADYFSSASRVTTLEGYFTSGSAKTALKWTSPIGIKIASSDGSGEGSAVNVDGSAGVTLKLPSTIKATFEGNITGDVTGNAATATKFSTARTVKLTGDVTGSASSDGTTTISEGVTGWSLSTTIANSAVTTDKINNLAVTTDKIAANAVTNAKLANSTIYINGTSFTLGDGSTQNKLTAKWGNARNISITDGTHAGNATSIDGGSASYSLALPSTISALFVGDLQGNASTASKLLDNTAYNLWGVEFFENGVPKSGNGNMTNVGNIGFSTGIKTIGGFVKVDHANSRLGIGLGENVSPSVTLDVNGNTTLGGVVKIGTTSSADVYLMRSSGDNYLHIPTGASLTIDHRTAGSSDNTARLTIKSDGDTWVRRNLIVDEHITGHKNIMADWGVSAEGIADLSLPVAGGGGGDVTSIKFDSTVPYHEGTEYTASSGILTLPAYPDTTNLATMDWVTTQISNLNLGTASTHAHNDYVTAITWDATNLKLKQTKGSDSATDIVQFKSLTIKGGTTSIGTYSPVSALEFSIVAGTNISVTPDATNHKITIANTYSLPTASDSTLGGVKVGDTLAISNGVLNQKSGIVTAGTYRSVTVDTYGRVTAGTNPTTLSGYGITDAKIEDGMITLGSSNITPVWALGISGDNLTYSQGTTTSNLTIPYATLATDARVEDKPSQEFYFRRTADGALTYKPTGAVIKKMYGNTVVWNQRANLNMLTGSNTTITKNATGFTSTAAAGSAERSCLFNSAFVANEHPYYLSFDYKSNLAYKVQDMNSARNMAVASNWTHNSKIGVRVSDSYTQLYWYLYSTTTESWNLEVKNVTIIDLTLFFNGNIPENLTPSEFEQKYNINGFYDYNAGQLINNSAEGLETVGRNLWDEEWERGSVGFYTGEPVSSDTQFRSQNFTPIRDNTTYCFNKTFNDTNVYFYDVNKNFIGAVSLGTSPQTFTTPSNSAFLKFRVPGTVYAHDICINLSDANFNGQYEPYKRNVLPLNLNSFKVKDSQGNIITITGGLKQAGDVRDEIVGRKLIQRVGSVDLGTLPWRYRSISGSEAFYAGMDSSAKKGASGKLPNIICSKYSLIGCISSYSLMTTDKAYTYYVPSDNFNLLIRDTAYTDADTFKTAMSGVMLYYELATPIEYEIIDEAPYEYPIDVLGTEKVVASSMVAPFKADIQYGVKQTDVAYDIDRLSIRLNDAFSQLDSVSIDHFSSLSDSIKDAHVIKAHDKELYLKFRATQGDATTNPQTLPSFSIAVADNDDGNDEQAFNFGTVTEADILAICHL